MSGRHVMSAMKLGKGNSFTTEFGADQARHVAPVFGQGGMGRCQAPQCTPPNEEKSSDFSTIFGEGCSPFILTTKISQKSRASKGPQQGLFLALKLP